MKKENRKRRKMIEAYQDMLNHGATGLHSVRREGGREGEEGGREGEEGGRGRKVGGREGGKEER